MLTNQSIGYMDAPVPKDLDLKEAIDKLRKEKNAIILAHYYQTGDILDIADYVGDSLALAQWAAKTKADIIVLCGVHFMGETAKILCPDKKVLVPDLNAGCSLAYIVIELKATPFKPEYAGVRRVRQATSRSYGNLLREYDRRRESGHGCGGYFHERPPDRGELPGRYTDDFRSGS